MQLARSVLYLIAIGLFFVVGQKLLQQAGHIGGKTWGMMK